MGVSTATARAEPIPLRATMNVAASFCEKYNELVDQTNEQRNAAGDATELQTRVDTLSVDLRKAGKRAHFRRCLIFANPTSVSTETALVVQRSENDSEMVELRLRSEFRDKEVARLNTVIGRLQEKTHAQ